MRIILQYCLRWILAVSVVLTMLFGIGCLMFPLPDKIEYSTCVLDEHGVVIHTFLTRDQQWRMKLSPSELSPQLKQTILFKEDKYFYFHPGVNPIAVIKSLFGNLVHGKIQSGASTITMQVARAMEPGRNRDIWIKVRYVDL